ncbi:hypothetical protein BH20CHL6_BH20CHL6_18460 [soil metagenome]
MRSPSQDGLTGCPAGGGKLYNGSRLPLPDAYHSPTVKPRIVLVSRLRFRIARFGTAVRVASSVPRLPRRRSRPPRAPELVALGDLMLDVMVAGHGMLELGSDTAGTVRFRAGGSAANVARAFARAGGRAVFVGAVGRDPWATRLVAALRADGVQVRAVRKPAPTGRIVVVLDRVGERSFITQRGAADGLARVDVGIDWFERSDCLHLPAYSLLNDPLADAALRAVELTRAAGGLVSVDLASRAPLLARGRADAFRRLRAVEADLLFANTSEAAALVGSSATGRLLDLAPVVVVKEGAAGCRVLSRSGSAAAPMAGGDRRGPMQLTVATTPLETLDTTGAGDAFDAGFLYAWLNARAEAASRPGSSGFAGAAEPNAAALLRRAAVAGHRAATRLLTRPRHELGA